MFHSNFINHQQCLANGGFRKVFLFVARWSRGMPILVIVEKGQDVSFLLELSPPQDKNIPILVRLGCFV